MLAGKTAFSGYSTDDVPQARAFYADTLGLDAREEDGMLNIRFPNGHAVLVYPKGADHQPATFTVLNIEVDDIDDAVRRLTAAGVHFERYDGMEQDEQGVARGDDTPPIAWFTDPAGNILSVIETAGGASA